MAEHDVAVFLVGLAMLLAAARVLGELARRVRFPAVAGELLAGVLLGPTVLGRLVPASVPWLFPTGAAANMLSGFTLLSAVLLLTLAGLEIDLSLVWRRRREAASTSLAGVALPMVLARGVERRVRDELAWRDGDHPRAGRARRRAHPRAVVRRAGDHGARHVRARRAGDERPLAHRRVRERAGVGRAGRHPPRAPRAHCGASRARDVARARRRHAD